MNASINLNLMQRKTNLITNKKDKFTLKNSIVKFMRRIILLTWIIKLLDGINNIRNPHLIQNQKNSKCSTKSKISKKIQNKAMIISLRKQIHTKLTNRFKTTLIINTINLMFKVLEIKHRSKMKVKMKQVMFNIQKSKIANKSQGITI